jgi:hypothetical protein
MSYKYWEKGSIYHSDLRRATEDNAGISFMLVSEVKLSKNKTDKIVKLQPYGDDDSYWYQAENQAIASQLEALPQDVWLIVKAHGDRASAVLEITDVDGVPIEALPSDHPHQPTGITPPPSTPPTPPSTQQPALVSTPPNEPQVPAGVPQVQDRREKVDDSMLECLCRAQEIVGRFAKLHDDAPPSDLVQRVGVSLFIEGH